MNLLEESSNEYNYQFPRWSSSLSRPQSSISSKNLLNDMFKLGIDNRNQIQRPDSSLPTKRIVEHHIHIPTGSPPSLNQPVSTPVESTQILRSSPFINKSRLYRSLPVRIKSTCLSIPLTKNKEFTLQNFPKQTHEQRKLTSERKRKKQQAQVLVDKYSENETWFQLKRSLSELKRLAITQDILIDPSSSLFNSDGNSLTTLKQVINEQKEEKVTDTDNYENKFSQPSFSTISSNELIRPSLTISRSSFSRPRTARKSFETHPRYIFEPLIVATKPIHSLLLSENHNRTLKLKIKPPPSSPLLRSRPNTTPLSEEKRARLLLSDLSIDDNPRKSSTPSPPLVKIEREIPSRKISTPSPTRVRAPSSIQLTSTIKLKSPTPRCHSATLTKSSYLTTKNYPRFILIADQEHRIESWYHQYPFIHSDDLLTSLQSKESQQKSIISGFFIDDLQSSNPHITAKTFLQGKPFHINNDWKKYDVIFISNNIFEEIIIYLQTIINLIKSSGKIIQIYQINHEEDLKKQVKHICKQLQQQNIQ